MLNALDLVNSTDLPTFDIWPLSKTIDRCKLYFNSYKICSWKCQTLNFIEYNNLFILNANSFNVTLNYLTLAYMFQVSQNMTLPKVRWIEQDLRWTWLLFSDVQFWKGSFYCFLAHLSTKCSWWAIVVSGCPSCVVVRRVSCVVRRPSCVNIW